MDDDGNDGRPWGFEAEDDLTEGYSSESRTAGGLPMEELQLGELGDLAGVARVEMEDDDVTGEVAEVGDMGLDENFAQASKAVSFGLETASRVYGLDTVITALQNIDETGRDAANPLEVIYERLAPTIEARENLYREMLRDSEKPRRAAFDLPTSENVLRVGRNAHGEFFEKDPENGWPERNHETSIRMIQALKQIIEALDADSRFAQLQEEAREAGLMPLEYLVREEVNPTLSYFLNQAGEATGIDIDELLTGTAKRIEEENAPTEVNPEMLNKEDEIDVDEWFNKTGGYK